MKSIGEKLKHIRKLNRLSQTEFSQMIGVSQGALSELEKNKYKPSVDAVIALKINFDIDLDWFMFEEELNKSTEIFSIKVDDFESKFISDLRKLDPKDKQELEGILDLKLNRYSREN